MDNLIRLTGRNEEGLLADRVQLYGMEQFPLDHLTVLEGDLSGLYEPGSRKIAAQNSEVTKKAALRVSDGIQEALENVREIRATNQEERYLAGLNQKIDDHEKVTIQGELGTGIFVNAASVIMRLGVATTILVGADLILSGQIDFMLLFLFLLVITRVYAPFDQSLALIAETRWYSLG